MRDKFKGHLDIAGSKAKSGFDQGRKIFSKTYVDLSSLAQERLNSEAPNELEAWCSWCGNHTLHKLCEKRRFGRATYQCSGCSFPTSRCRYCDNMAKSASLGPETNTVKAGEQGNRVSAFFANNWTNELCSEHDGTIPDFSRAHEKIASLSEFEDLMKPKQKNLYGMAKRSIAIIGGVAAIGTGAILAAPGIATGMGTAGTLGAAGTGTAISSLSRAALMRAALTRLGAGGLAIITATGAGLGGKAGFGVANAYFKDVPDFRFIPLRDSEPGTSKHTVIVINGFLTQNDLEANDWSEALEGFFDQDPVWLANWEANTLLKLGTYISGFGTSFLSGGTLRTGIRLGVSNIAKGVTKSGLVLTAAQLASNPWHSAMLNAEKVGTLLAEAISRTEGQTFTLIGHSLGARVAFYALQALATKEQQFVNDVVLMGAAVGTGNPARWKAAQGAVKGQITNCYSRNDQVLNILYKAANVGLSRPAGREAVAGITSLDCTDFISGHNTWKQNLPEVIERINASRITA